MSTSKSTKTIQDGIEFVLKNDLQTLLLEIPGINMIVLFGIIEDIADPFGYENLLSKEAIDSYNKTLWDSLLGHFQSVQWKSAIEAGLAKATTLNDEEKQISFNRSFSMWHSYSNVPEKFDFCFNDMINPVGSEVSMSGAPVDGCNKLYRDPYDKYVTENKQKYIDEQITKADTIIENINALTETTSSISIDNQRDGYLETIYILAAIVGLVLLAVLGFFLYNRFNK